MTEPDADSPQPRDIALEQPSPELLDQLDEQSSEPDDPKASPA